MRYLTLAASFATTTALTGAALTGAAIAQDAPFELGEIIVSGGLSPISATALGRSSSVVTAQEIEDRGITTVQDALRALPGVSVNGTSNSFAQVRIRGAEANHTLILIDGIEAAGGDGSYTLSGLETANIERVEVLRGPQSVYYGSNASSGVINIITRKGGLGRTLSGSLEVGESTIATAFAAFRDERGGVSLSLAHTDDPGYDQSGSGGEKDSLTRSSVIFSGDYLVTDALKLGFSLRKSDERYDTDSLNGAAANAAGYVVDDPTQFSNRDEMTATAYAELSTYNGRMTHRLAYEKTDNDQSFNGFAPTTTEAEAVKYRLSFGLDGRAASEADHLLNVLLENQQDSSSSNPAFGRETTSIAAEYRASLSNGLDLQLGVRFDDNSTFKDATSWTLGLSYQLPQSGIRLHASAGNGTVNPTYFELFANAFGFTGNPNLRPEENMSFDVGVEIPFAAGRGVVDVTYFNETLTDEITSVATGPGAFSFINQAGDSTREGIEVAGTFQATDALSLRLGYTYLDAKNPNGSVEIRRPEHELAFGATLDTFNGRGSISADLRHVSGNADTQFFGAFQTIDLPEFTTFDLAAQYDLTDTLTLTGRIDNVFDTTDTEVWGFAARGRTVHVGLRASF